METRCHELEEEKKKQEVTHTTHTVYPSELEILEQFFDQPPEAHPWFEKLGPGWTAEQVGNYKHLILKFIHDDDVSHDSQVFFKSGEIREWVDNALPEMLVLSSGSGSPDVPSATTGPDSPTKDDTKSSTDDDDTSSGTDDDTTDESPDSVTPEEDAADVV